MVLQMGLLRLLPPRYENGFNTPVGWQKGRLYNGFPLPNARKVSQMLVSTSEITPNPHLSAMIMQWGQFVGMTDRFFMQIDDFHRSRFDVDRNSLDEAQLQ